MASHPYISGAGNITQMVGFLRKNFPASVTSETVKKLGIASKNESYVINALQFIGLIDEQGKKLAEGADVLLIRDEAKFQEAFAGLVKEAYRDLFDLRADDAWTLSKDELIGYFRSADKTSEVIGTRQAGVFQALRTLAGYNAPVEAAKTANTARPTNRSSNPKSAKVTRALGSKKGEISSDGNGEKVKLKRDMALTVRIEINLPSDGSQQTYDKIFKSIKENFLDE